MHRKQALAEGKRYYNTGAVCTRGHTGDRYVCSGDCVECAVARANRRYAAKKEEVLLQSKERYAADPEKVKRQVAKRRLDNPEQVKQEKRREYERHRKAYILRGRDWTKKNPEKAKQCVKNWCRNNPDKVSQYSVTRRMRLNHRSPSWVTESEENLIANVYREARQLSQKTGIRHQVDHIIPLNGSRVSGLHVLGNLQILTAVDNRAKWNNFQDVV